MSSQRPPRRSQTVEIHVDTETLEALRRVADNLAAASELLRQNSRLLTQVLESPAQGVEGTLKVS